MVLDFTLFASWHMSAGNKVSFNLLPVRVCLILVEKNVFYLVDRNPRVQLSI